MKKLIYFIGLIFLLSTNVVMAQSFCGIKIIKEDGEPECLLTAYEEKTAFPVNDDFGDDETTLVCRGKTVTYTANNTGNSSISSYEWTVNGSDNYTITNNGKTITVKWDDPTAQQVSLQVTATSPEGVSCTDTKYMYIVETPVLNTTVIQGYIENPNGVKTIRVCQGETVEFIDNSQYVSKTNVTGYYWETDNYGNASTKNFKIENITVPTTVTHKIMSYCGCEAEEVFLIEVLPEKAIQLSCHGTACEGSIVTYEPEGITCSQYNWVVENGTIIGSSTAQQVKVQWGAPESGYGIISLDGSECEGVCPKLVPVKIPIISSNVAIAGSENACEDESVVFELPLWGSTEYIWEITPSIPMLDADHPNKKIITFSQKGTYTLTCKVRCPFLDCGELTVQSKTITVKPRLNINGKSSICAGGSSSFTTNATSQTASSVQWTLSKNKQTLATYTGSTFNYTFTQSGNYQLEAINSEYCNTAVMYIDVQTLPLPQIAGNNNVCVYDGDSLTVTNANPNYWVKWSCNVPGASPQNLTSDNSFVVKFNGVVGNVSARFEDNNGCLSDVATFEIHEFQLDDLTPFLPTQVTGKKTGDTIHLQIPKQHGVFYRWSVPSGRATLLTDFTSNDAVFVVNRSKDGTYPDFQIRLQRVFCNDYTNPTFDCVTVSGVTEANITISGNKCTNNQLTFSTDRTDTDDSHYTWTINGQTYTGKTVNAAFTTAGHKVVKLKYKLLSGNNAYIQTATLNIKNCTGTNSLGELEEAGDIVSGGTVYETNNDLPSIIDSIDHPFWEYYASCNVYFDCDSNQIVVNEIKYGLYSGITLNPSSYLLWKKDNGNWVQVPVHSFSIPLSSLNIDNDGSTITVHFFDGYSSCTREITVYPPVTNISATITHPSDNSNLCSESPYLFTANVSGDYDYCYWDFGNGSVMEGDTVEYAYVYDSIISNEYWVTIVAVDKNGCEHILDSVFYTVGQSPVLGTLVASEAVCPGEVNLINIDSDFDGILPISWNPEKLDINDNGNIMNYLAYQTGDYSVKVKDNTGCISETLVNVYFYNKPKAEFTYFSSRYCEGLIEIDCFNDNGSYHYDWKITKNGQIITTMYNTASNSYITNSLTTGTYNVEVTVYNEHNCSDNISGTFTIYPNPPMPTLSIDPAHACIHTPSVIINGTPSEVFWSNGTHGSQTHYYQSGYVNAWVMDTNSGCSSATTNIFITPAPNFDALLTGCYEKCTPTEMETFGLSPIPFNNWRWNLNGSTIQNGTEQNPTLRIPSAGVYNMQAYYGGFNCFVQSDDLQIRQPETCGCDSITVTQVRTRYDIRDCRITYRVEITICNNSNEVLNIDQWLCQDDVNIINIQGSNTIAPHGCETFILTFEVAPYLDFASFTILCNHEICEREFALALNHKESIAQGRCDMRLDAMKYSTSDGLVVDIDFVLSIPNPANVLYVWTEPQGVVTYNYDGLALISGFAVFDYLKLVQMANDEETLCFYVMMCQEDGTLCIAEYCVRVSSILRRLQSKSQKESILEQQTEKVYLLPNPAKDKVTIIGLNDDEINNSVVMDMTGKELIRNNQTNIIDISDIQKGSYLIVVESNDNKVYYLKLIKQ